MPGKPQNSMPIPIHRQLKAQKKLEGAKAQIWDLIEELDQSLQIKSLTYALLSPIALN